VPDDTDSQMGLRKAQATLEAEVQAIEAATKKRAERFKLAAAGLEERTAVVKAREAELDAAAAKAEKTASELKTKKAVMNKKLQEAARKMEQTEQAIAAAQETLTHADEVAKVRERPRVQASSAVVFWTKTSAAAESIGTGQFKQLSLDSFLDNGAYGEGVRLGYRRPKSWR